MGSYTTIEYILQKPPALPPIFLLVIDTCADDEDLKALKNSIVVCLSSFLPPNALVGLITFGAMVHVHELAFSECPKSFVFKGTKDYPAKQIQEMLGLGGMPQRQPRQQQPNQAPPRNVGAGR